MMELLQGLVLGAVQGLTEFFPVSSSGHLVLVPALFGWKDQGVAFDTIIHGGTLVALLTVFWGDLARGAQQLVEKKDASSKALLIRICVAALPALAMGAIFGGIIERTLRHPLFVAAGLAGWGLVLLAADQWRATRPATITDPRKVGWAQALIVGAVQAVALMPGTSRSGITMTAGLFAGMDRKTAVDFSFFLSIPTITAAFGYGLLRLFRQGPVATEQIGMLIIGFIAAALMGIIAIRFLRTYVATHSFRPFVWYRFVLAAFIIAMAPLIASAAPVPTLKMTALPPVVDSASFGALLVIDKASGQTLYALEPDRSWTPASLTKLMTAVSFTSTPRTWTAAGTITSADEVGGGRLAVPSGSRMTLRDLLYSAVVGSANNAAEALARQSGIGRAAFIAKMNADAKALGLTRSAFEEASGMSSTNTTSAYDIAVLLDRASQQPEIQKAMVAFNYPFTVASPRVSKNIKNTNGLLFIEPDIWVTAGKTGYLDESRYNLAVSVKPSPKLLAAQTAVGNPGGELSIIVFGSPTRDGAVQTTASLAKWAWDNIQWQGNAATFTRNRGLNDRGPDIKQLQAALNAKGTPVAATGPGAPGKETDRFGTLTQAALSTFQQKNGLPATGYLDFRTRALLNGISLDPLLNATTTQP